MTAAEWDWSLFQGSKEALKYNRRDLPVLDRVIASVPQKRVAVQAGANLGIYPKRLAQSFEAVYCFEPSAELFPMLLKNAPETNILRFQAALGQTHEMVGTSRVRRDGKLNAHEGITYVCGTGLVPTLRLDDLCLPVCDLIQLDVEGYELNAMRGAVDTLARCRPVVLLEMNKNLAFMGLTEADAIDFMADHGYAQTDVMGSDRLFRPVESL